MRKQVRGHKTPYNGYTFRSRVEARWAVFLDAACVMYEYEPQPFDIEGEKGYLPDFFLDIKASRVINRLGKCSLRPWHDRGMWGEVKHGPPTDEEVEKLWLVCSETGHPGIFLIGDPDWGRHHKLIFPEGCKNVDLDFNWMACPQCGDVSLVYPWVLPLRAHIQLRCCDHRTPVDSRAYSFAVDALDHAVYRAKSAQFEYEVQE